MGKTIRRWLWGMGLACGANVAAAAAPDTAVWKRGPALARDLARALDLPLGDVCAELGVFACVDDVFVTPLGGNDPFALGQYEAPAEPMATTPIAVDRVVMAACRQRVRLDGQDAPRVFRFTPPAAVVPTAPRDAEAQAKEMVRRFLGRDPGDAEAATLARLARDGRGLARANAAYATLLCYVVGTSAEFLFY